MLLSPTSCFLLLPLHLLLLHLLLLLVRRRRPIPVNWPVVGMAPAFILNFHRIISWAAEIFPQAGIYNFMFRGPWLLGMDFLIVLDPANANHILNLNHSNYPKGEYFQEVMDVLGDGIVNSDAGLWQYQRREAHALMGAAGFRASLSGRIRDKVENGLLPLMTHLARRREAVDLQDLFLRFTSDLSCVIVLGVDPGSLSAGFPANPFCNAVQDIDEIVILRHTLPTIWWKLLRWLGVGQEKRMAAAVEVIDRFMYEHISRIKEERINGREAPESGMLSSFLDCEPPLEYGKGVKNIGTDTFLRDIGFNFLAAGMATIAAALTWFFFMLSKNPDVEAKIVKELSGLAPASMEDGGGEMAVFDGEQLAELVYLHAALCETLRLFPTVPRNDRVALREDVLPSGQRVAAGTRIVMFMHTMARMEGIWGQDCRQFRPERWISEKGKLRHEPSYKFVSFSSGPRRCMGKDITFAQMKMAAAAMVYNFEVEVVGGQVVEPKSAAMTLVMKNGLKVKIRERSTEMLHSRTRWDPPGET